MLYDDVGGGRLVLVGVDDEFCLAMLAKASNMDEPLGGAGAAAPGALFCTAASAAAGGLPGGVVEDSVRRHFRLEICT